MLVLTPFMLAVIVVVPVAALLASPFPPIEATLTLEDVQVTSFVRISVVPSLKLPVAVKRSELPNAMLGSVGVMVSEVSVAGVTESVAVPTCPEKNAVIVALPAATPVASPLLPTMSLTVAIDAGDDVHEADCVRSCVLPSANVPMALNCASVCCATLALAGVICSDTSAADSTTTAIVPLIEPSCALMVALPADCPVSWPALLTLATLPADELQLTELVIVWVLPSLNVPVAVQPSVDAAARTALGGVTAIETSVTELTVNGVDAVTPSSVALMLELPGATADASPTVAIVATLTLSDAHVTSLVMICVLESLNVPVAVNDKLVAGAIVRLTGVTEIDSSVAFVTSSVTDALTDPSVAVIVDKPLVKPFARPLALPILATPVFEEVHAD